MHQFNAADFADAKVVRDAIAALPPAYTVLPAGTQKSLTPVNTDRTWANGLGKRALDLLIAVPALIFFAPLLLAIAALVRLDSKGPAFFRQRRAGASGHTFEIFKFRSMSVMENGTKVIQAQKDDPRTTRVGRVLRRTSLDELPQLINVVLGDMSLVGPRPHAMAHDAYYSDLIVGYRERYSVKPGITGWAQIHGHRGPTPTAEVMAARIAHDVWYARNANLMLDLKILLRTPFEVVRSRNAF